MKKLMALLVLVGLGFVLTGCGGSETPPPTPPATNAPPAAPAAPK